MKVQVSIMKAANSTIRLIGDIESNLLLERVGTEFIKLGDRYKLGDNGRIIDNRYHQCNCKFN